MRVKQHLQRCTNNNAQFLPSYLATMQHIWRFQRRTLLYYKKTVLLSFFLLHKGSLGWKQTVKKWQTTELHSFKILYYSQYPPYFRKKNNNLFFLNYHGKGTINLLKIILPFLTYEWHFTACDYYITYDYFPFFCKKHKSVTSKYYYVILSFAIPMRKSLSKIVQNPTIQLYIYSHVISGNALWIQTLPTYANLTESTICPYWVKYRNAKKIL